MKILLTGFRGNLGQSLIRQGGEHIWLTVDRNGWHDFDDKVKDADVVIHAASDLLTSVAKQPYAVMDANIITTARVLESLPSHKSLRLIFISSCAVYGQSQITDEEIHPTPISVNGLGKLINEKMIAEYCGDKKIEFQILRLFNTFGGNDRFSILSHLKKSILEKTTFTMFNEGVSQRDFLHVDDAADLVLRLTKLPARHRTMNLGCGETTRIADIVAQARIKYPNLEVKHSKKTEAEYSRAEISRLRSVFPDFRFRRVLDFIRAEF
jgi:UDP-glucose 4-epimerase